MIDLTSEKVDIRLRVKLEQITRQEFEKHPNLIANLHSEYPHSIELATEVAPLNVPLLHFTCFNYAFDLLDSNVMRVVNAFPKLLSDGQFVSNLVKHRLEEFSATEIRNGDMVMYSDEKEIKHSGKAFSGFVISKWGRIGYLWRHRLFEIPSSYGDNVRFFRRLDRSVSEQVFLDYAKSKHGEAVIDELLAP